MTDRTITLGTQALPIHALPLGTLRRLVPAFSRTAASFSVGRIDDDVFDDVFAILAAGTGLPASKLEEMPGTFKQLMEAVEAVADVCGLTRKGEGPSPGEPVPGPSPASTPGTLSTPV